MITLFKYRYHNNWDQTRHNSLLTSAENKHQSILTSLLHSKQAMSVKTSFFHVFHDVSSNIYGSYEILVLGVSSLFIKVQINTKKQLYHHLFHMPDIHRLVTLQMFTVGRKVSLLGFQAYSQQSIETKTTSKNNTHDAEQQQELITIYHENSKSIVKRNNQNYTLQLFPDYKRIISSKVLILPVNPFHSVANCSLRLVKLPFLCTSVFVPFNQLILTCASLMYSLVNMINLIKGSQSILK